MCVLSHFLASHILPLILTTSQVTCRIKRDFSGSGCALNFGLLTCLCTPRCGDARVKVETGDVVIVTRDYGGIGSMVTRDYHKVRVRVCGGESVGV